MIKVIELCCGYGGATEGMLQAGFEMEVCYDVWPTAVEQHQNWHPTVPCEVRDVKTVAPDELEGRFVWASLPCQPWSTANQRKEVQGKAHPHYYSLAHFARQVQHSRVAVLENVPGLVHTRHGRAEIAELERECARLGLSLSINLLYSHHFGVNQYRRRVFIVIGGGLTLFSPGSSRADVSQWAVMATEGKGSSGRQRVVTASNFAGVGGGKPSRAVRATAGGGVDTLEYSHKLPLAVTTGRQGQSWTRSTREGAVLASESKGRQAESETRSRTLEECAALQGVPVPVGVSKTAAYALIGNCVPPRLAEAVSSQVFV